MLDGFMEADRARQLRNDRLKISAVLASVVLGLVLCAAGFAGSVTEGGLLGVTEASSSDQADAPASGAEGAEAAAEADGEEAAVETNEPALSGTVKYTYLTDSAEGGEVTVEEAVAFDADGYAETSFMRLSFETEEAAAAFVMRVERDYGTAFLSGAAEGETAWVRLDVSARHLNRTAYQRALAETARELSVSDDAHSV